MRIVGFSWFDCRQSTTGRRGRRFVWWAGSGGVDIIAGPSVVFWGVSDCRQSMGALGGCRHAWLAGLGVSTPSRVQGVVFWTVDSQWQSLGLSGRVVGRFRGGAATSSRAQGVVFWGAADCQLSIAAHEDCNTLGWPVQGGRHHRESRGWCVGNPAWGTAAASG